MPSPSAPTKTVRTTFKGVMISLPAEGVVSGGTAVYLSPRLESYLEHDWRRLPLPMLTDRSAVRSKRDGPWDLVQRPSLLVAYGGLLALTRLLVRLRLLVLGHPGLLRAG
jgi:hypothetical protein